MHTTVIFLKKHTFFLVVVCVILLGAYFRFTGIQWDANQHLHPDERFLTMVTQSMVWPNNISEYFDTKNSLLNPENIGFSFYVYGTWPLLLVKMISEIFGAYDYNGITITGRIVSGIIDMFNLVVVMFCAYQLAIPKYKKYSTLIAGFFYACMPLSIQLSHYYAVDPYVVGCILLSYALLFFPIHPLTGIGIGLFVGAAISAKISAAYSTPLLIIGVMYRSMGVSWDKRFLYWFAIVFTLFATIWFAYPYFFDTNLHGIPTVNSRLMRNFQELKSFDTPGNWFPPATMWSVTKPILYPVESLGTWGIGLPLSVILILGMCIAVMRRKYFILYCFVANIIFLFLYQGIQYTKHMRYFWVILPQMCIVASIGIGYLSSQIRSKNFTIMLHICIGFLITLWPLMFVSVYKTPHTRVVASEWIRKNIPITKTLSAEHWDDALPLCLPHLPCAQYTLIEFPLYEPDSTNKWINMYEKLSHTDYIVMSSNRLYGSITWAHKRYPQTNAYYHALFNELLGFKLIQTFTSRPTLTNPMIHACLPIPWSTYGKVSKTSQQCNTNGMSLIDDYGDESFTVYDHPAVSIFKKEKLISQETFLQLLGDNTTEDSLQK